jgi:hypothetical protein
MEECRSWNALSVLRRAGQQGARSTAVTRASSHVLTKGNAQQLSCSSIRIVTVGKAFRSGASGDVEGMCFTGLTGAQYRAFGVDGHCIMFGVIYTHLLYMFSKRIRGTLFSATSKTISFHAGKFTIRYNKPSQSIHRFYLCLIRREL